MQDLLSLWNIPYCYFFSSFNSSSTLIWAAFLWSVKQDERKLTCSHHLLLNSWTCRHSKACTLSLYVITCCVVTQPTDSSEEWLCPLVITFCMAKTLQISDSTFSCLQIIQLPYSLWYTLFLTLQPLLPQVQDSECLSHSRRPVHWQQKGFRKASFLHWCWPQPVQIWPH